MLNLPTVTSQVGAMSPYRVIPGTSLSVTTPSSVPIQPVAVVPPSVSLANSLPNWKFDLQGYYHSHKSSLVLRDTVTGYVTVYVPIAKDGNLLLVCYYGPSVDKLQRKCVVRPEVPYRIPWMSRPDTEFKTEINPGEASVSTSSSSTIREANIYLKQKSKLTKKWDLDCESYSPYPIVHYISNASVNLWDTQVSLCGKTDNTTDSIYIGVVTKVQVAGTMNYNKVGYLPAPCNFDYTVPVIFQVDVSRSQISSASESMYNNGFFNINYYLYPVFYSYPLPDFWFDTTNPKKKTVLYNDSGSYNIPSSYLWNYNLIAHNLNLTTTRTPRNYGCLLDIDYDSVNNRLVWISSFGYINKESTVGRDISVGYITPGTGFVTNSKTQVIHPSSFPYISPKKVIASIISGNSIFAYDTNIPQVTILSFGTTFTSGFSSIINGSQVSLLQSGSDFYFSFIDSTNCYIYKITDLSFFNQEQNLRVDTDGNLCGKDLLTTTTLIRKFLIHDNIPSPGTNIISKTVTGTQDITIPIYHDGHDVNLIYGSLDTTSTPLFFDYYLSHLSNDFIGIQSIIGNYTNISMKTTPIFINDSESPTISTINKSYVIPYSGYSDNTYLGFYTGDPSDNFFSDIYNLDYNSVNISGATISGSWESSSFYEGNGITLNVLLSGCVGYSKISSLVSSNTLQPVSLIYNGSDILALSSLGSSSKLRKINPVIKNTDGDNFTLNLTLLLDPNSSFSLTDLTLKLNLVSDLGIPIASTGSNLTFSMAVPNTDAEIVFDHILSSTKAFTVPYFTYRYNVSTNSNLNRIHKFRYDQSDKILHDDIASPDFYNSTSDPTGTGFFTYDPTWLNTGDFIYVSYEPKLGNLRQSETVLKHTNYISYCANHQYTIEDVKIELYGSAGYETIYDDSTSTDLIGSNTPYFFINTEGSDLPVKVTVSVNHETWNLDDERYDKDGTLLNDYEVYPKISGVTLFARKTGDFLASYLAPYFTHDERSITTTYPNINRVGAYALDSLKTIYDTNNGFTNKCKLTGVDAQVLELTIPTVGSYQLFLIVTDEFNQKSAFCLTNTKDYFHIPLENV